jgi:hypothetical protein
MALAGGNGMFAAVDHPGVELASVRKALMLGFARDYYSNRPQMQAKKCGLQKKPHQKIFEFELQLAFVASRSFVAMAGSQKVELLTTVGQK